MLPAKCWGIPSRSMMGKQAETLISIPANLSRAVLQRTALIDVEGILNVDQREINCLISLDFVFKTQDELQWIIITLRPGKKVRKLVQSQVGANATLTLDDIPGDSPQLHRVRSFVKSAAGAQASILIRGEVGTGKNALARAIHNAAHRKDGPFVVFSCSSIPNELVISELLGYEEGDESRHLSGRPSKFELADGGTLFFQNVDVLPLEAQSVLLNALELGVIQRLGSQRAGGNQYARGRLHFSQYGNLDGAGSLPPGSVLSSQYIYCHASSSAGASTRYSTCGKQNPGPF